LRGPLREAVIGVNGAAVCTGGVPPGQGMREVIAKFTGSLLLKFAPGAPGIP
jgi:hypothetical protein